MDYIIDDYSIKDVIAKDDIMNDKAHVSSMPLLGRTTDAPLLWRDRRFRSFGKTLHIIICVPDGLVE